MKAGQKRKAQDQLYNRAKQSRNSGNDKPVPTIVIPEDLIGKKVNHYCYGDDGNCDWFTGIVVETCGNNVNEPDYLIR